MVGPQCAERGRIFLCGGWYNARCLYVPAPVSDQRAESGFSPRAPTGTRESDVDSIGCTAIALSAGIILTTIHTHDYKDARGDAAAGRVTLPIAYPTLSRVVTAFVLLAWSWGISLTWRLDSATAAATGVLSLIVGVSFIARRDTRADVVSSYLYNVSRKCPSILENVVVSQARSMPGVALCRIFTPRILQAALGFMTRPAICFESRLL